VKTGYYSYYNYVYGPENSDIQVKLTTLAGDPDIYISTNSDIKFPTAKNSDIVSTSDWTSDEIIIPFTKIPAKCLNTTFEQGFCTLHIGVFCDDRFGASSFSLVVSRLHKDSKTGNEGDETDAESEENKDIS